MVLEIVCIFVCGHLSLWKDVIAGGLATALQWPILMLWVDFCVYTAFYTEFESL